MTNRWNPPSHPTQRERTEPSWSSSVAGCQNRQMHLTATREAGGTRTFVTCSCCGGHYLWSCASPASVTSLSEYPSCCCWLPACNCKLLARSLLPLAFFGSHCRKPPHSPPVGVVRLHCGKSGVVLCWTNRWLWLRCFHPAVWHGSSGEKHVKTISVHCTGVAGDEQEAGRGGG